VRAQRQKLFFLIATIILTILIVGGGRYYLHSVRPIRIAAGPAGTVEYRFAEKLAELVTAKASDVRVSIITDESAAAATSGFARGDADLGFVRTDQKFPGSARALALIEHFAFILVVPKGSKIGSLGDLRGKKVAFVTSESGAEARCFAPYSPPHRWSLTVSRCNRCPAGRRSRSVRSSISFRRRFYSRRFPPLPKRSASTG
jgi:ABC-type nitrate/sulfonate/bicarbonate transport system substrate-binding protein